MKRTEKAQAVSKTLNRIYKKVPIPLRHKNKFELVVAVLLSAQCTDERVNKVTPILFKKANTAKKMIKIAKEFCNAKGTMFLGRGYSFPIALEGALKLKELAYVHAEGYPAGEMKHGPLALIENGMPVVVIAPRDKFYSKTISNMQEVISRGGKVLLISNKSTDEVSSENLWKKIQVETISDDLFPFLVTSPLQLLAYYAANALGYDIDKPRNLAKSVTVE